MRVVNNKVKQHKSIWEIFLRYISPQNENILLHHFLLTQWQETLSFLMGQRWKTNEDFSFVLPGLFVAIKDHKLDCYWGFFYYLIYIVLYAEVK